jgi:hypothetical protein
MQDSTFKWKDFYSLLLLALICVQLFVPPVTGLANNGDFERLMSSVGLSYDENVPYEEKYFKYINLKFNLDPDNSKLDYMSSEILLLYLAIFLNRWFSEDGLFDLRYLGAVHALFYVAASIYLIHLISKLIKPGIGRHILLIILVVFLSDVALVSYFNSFYSESATLISLLYLVVFFFRLYQQQKLDWKDIVIFYFVSIMLISAKVQNCVLVVLLAIIGIRLFFLMERKKLTIFLCTFATLSLILVSALVYSSSPDYIKRFNIFNSVFYGIAKDSPTAEEHLKKLGLGEDYHPYIGLTIFDERSPKNNEQVMNDFVSKVSHGDVIRFYLTNPKRFFEVSRDAAKSTLVMKLDYLGTREKENSGQSSDFNVPLFHKLQNVIIPKSLGFLICYYVFSIIVAIYLFRKPENRYEKEFAGFYLFLLLGATMQFFAAFIGDGLQEIEKHLFLYNLLFFFSLFVLIIVIMKRHTSIIRYLRKVVIGTE